MRVYESDSIRNVGVIGHGASGKTSLTSAMSIRFGRHQPAGAGR